jgi:shikimate 5-dehydrogenase
MLIFQGMAAFRLFTGKSVPYTVFRKGFGAA